MSGHETTRRRFVVAVGSAAAMLAIRDAQAQMQANPAAFGAAIGKVTGGAEVKKGRVKLDIPPLSENGNTVATTVTVESPMTAKDYVKAIHLFAEKNPQPNIISVHEVGLEGETVYIVSDFVEGLPLCDWQTGQKITHREAAELCEKLARALD